MKRCGKAAGRVAGRGPGLWALGWALIAAFWLGPAWEAGARSVPVPFGGEYLSSVWGLEEGMPENSCSGIVPGPDGALWLGTFRGLARFNGSSISRYSPKGMPELGNVGVVNIYRESGGRIWLSTLAGLVSHEGGTWRRWGEADGWKTAGEYVRAYAERPGFEPVLTRFGGQVYRLEGGRFQDLPTPPGQGGSWPALDGDGLLYVVRGGFAGFFRDGAWVALELPQDVLSGLSGAAQSRDGTALVIGRQQVLRYRGGRLVGRLDLSMPVGQFWQAVEDSTGAFWLPGVAAGVYRIRPDGEVKWLRRAEGLAHSGSARVVYEDEDGGIWVGSGVGGVACLRPPRFRYAGEQEGLLDVATQSLATMGDGRVLLGLYGAGPRFFDGVRLGPALPGWENDIGWRVRTLLRTRDGKVWVGAARRGLVEWDGAGVQSIATTLFPTNSTLSTMFEDSMGRVWVGEENRVGVIGPGGVREVAIPGRGQPGTAVFFAEHAGVVLLAWRRTVFRYTDGEGLREWLKLPESARVTGLVAERSGRVWVGSNGSGLFAYDGIGLRRVGVTNGMPSDLVGSMIFDDAGFLWFASGRLAVRGEPDNLWRVAGGASGEEVRLRLFGESDGLRGLDFPVGTQPTVGKDERGRLWFALVRGAAMVDPAQLKFRDRPPPVEIESLRYVPKGGRQPVEASLGGTEEPVLPAGIRQVQIRYTALDMAAPERHRFRVRLGGDRAEWQDMGGEREVVFFELPPGRHRLRVRASGSDGIWNPVGAELGFVVSPFYWETLWFRAVVGMVLLGLAGAGGWLMSIRRLRQLKVQDALRRLATALTAALDAGALGRKVGVTCRALFGHDAFFLVLLNRDGTIRLCAHVEDTREGGSGPEPVPGGVTSLGPELAPVLAGEPLLINRTGAREPAPQGPASQGFGARRAASLLYAPIVWEGATIGVVSVQSYVPGRYGPADLDQLRTLGSHCGAAIARMEAEEQRRGDEQRLRLAMETARMGSWEIDLRTGRLTVSPEAESVYGFSPGTMTGTLEQLWSRMAESEFGAVRGPLEEIRAGRATALDVVHRITVGGVERWLELKGLVRLEPGDTGGGRLIGITADITARKLAEMARARLEEQLRQSQKQEAIGTLAGGIAHDFNNLLAAILGNVETARADVGSAHAASESLEEIQKSGLRARDLVRRILAFSRPQEHQPRVLALGDVIQEVAQLMRSTIPSRVEIVTTLDPGTPPVMADASQIHQVLLNLGTNAWHALEGNGGRIEFRLAPCEVDEALRWRHPGLRPGLHARVEIIDDGKGMEPGLLERIFDPFFTTKAPGQGTGLGLSVALAIVQSHLGAIGVESQPGRGATFRLYFPAANAGGVDPDLKVASVPAVRSGLGARVLFVDDEVSLVRVATLRLQRAGYQVMGCVDVAEALEAFRADPDRFDLIVTDQSMPGMTGIEFAREVFRLRPGATIVLVSGNLSDADAEMARRIGVRAVLRKPEVVNELLPAMERLLSGAGGESGG